ncbi:MAG: carboxylating nicotinate-nucleotide diphosphorylase [Nanoarchaeota archaeon]
MDRKKLLNKAFQRGHLLNLKNRFYKDWIKKFIIDDINEDIGSGDITSDSIFGKGKQAKALIYSRSVGIVSGIEEVTYILQNSKIKVTQLCKDGSKIKNGTKLLSIEGNIKDILKVERSVLDILSRMSGISTKTQEIIKKIGDSAAIAPTRKTLKRYPDKKAVFIGGGLTHRLALWESILIKDNHLSFHGIESALNLANCSKKANFIEIEVRNKLDAIKAARKFKELKSSKPCLIMLDNMPPDKIKKTIITLKKENLLDYALIEASGGITHKNIKNYAGTGVDVISLGILTNSVKPLDMKLKIK